MGSIVVHDFANARREVEAHNVSKVLLDEGRVWVQLMPGFQMIEARNVDDVKAWASETEIQVEEFDEYPS